MKAFIYMNEKIRQREPSGPVIHVQIGETVRAGNHVAIDGPSVVRFDPRGLRACKTHHVTAWIEVNCDDVLVVVR